MRTDVHQLFQMLKPYIASMLRDSVGGVQGVGVGGGGSSGSGLSQHALSGQHHTGTLSDTQAPQFLLRDGTRSLTGHLSVENGITIDGVQLAGFWALYQAHIINKNAHHKAFVGLSVEGTPINPNGVSDRIDFTGSGSIIASYTGVENITYSLATPGTLTGVTTNNSVTASHTHNIDAYSDPGSTQNRILMTGASGFVKLHQLQVTDWFQLHDDVRIQRTSPNVVDFIGNVGQGVRVRFNEQVQIGTPFLTSAYNDALMVNVSTLENGLRLRRVEGGGGSSYISAYSDGSLLLKTDGSVWFEPGGNFLYPHRPYQVNIGSLQNKYLTLHAAELWVETLVAHETMATIGGRILVGRTSTLELDLDSSEEFVTDDFSNGADFVNKHTFEFPGGAHYTVGSGDDITLMMMFVAIRGPGYADKFHLRADGWRLYDEQFAPTLHRQFHMAVFYRYGIGTGTAPFVLRVFTDAGMTVNNEDNLYVHLLYEAKANVVIWKGVSVVTTTSRIAAYENVVPVDYDEYAYSSYMFAALVKSVAGYSTTFEDVSFFDQLQTRATGNGVIFSSSWLRQGFYYGTSASGREIEPVDETSLRQMGCMHVSIMRMPPLALKHNSFVPGDILYMEADGKVEFYEVMTKSAQTEPPYFYSVKRNLDGSGLNDWYAGDAIFSTGNRFQLNTGFIDLYSVHGTKGQQISGPSISFNVRTGSAHNDWYTRAHIGNLNGVYGYGTDRFGFAAGNEDETWIAIDEISGMRIMHNQTVNAQWDINGNMTIGKTSTNLGNVYIQSNGTLHLRQGTTPKITLNSDGTSTFLGHMFFGLDGGFWQGTGTWSSPTSGVKLWNESGSSKIGAWNASQKTVEINSDGVIITTPTDWETYSGLFFENIWGTTTGRISGTQTGLEIRNFGTVINIQGNPSGQRSGIHVGTNYLNVSSPITNISAKDDLWIQMENNTGGKSTIFHAEWADGALRTVKQSYFTTPIDYDYYTATSFRTLSNMVTFRIEPVNRTFLSGLYDSDLYPLMGAHVSAVSPKTTYTGISINMISGVKEYTSALASNAVCLDSVSYVPGDNNSMRFTGGHASYPYYSQMMVFNGFRNEIQFFNSTNANYNDSAYINATYKKCIQINNDGSTTFYYDIDASTTGNLTFDNGATQFQSYVCKWKRSGAKMVFLQGAFELNHAAGVKFTTLPAQCRPTGLMNFTCWSASGSIRVTVSSNGDIACSAALTGWVSVDSISFVTF